MPALVADGSAPWPGWLGTAGWPSTTNKITRSPRRWSDGPPSIPWPAAWHEAAPRPVHRVDGGL